MSLTRSEPSIQSPEGGPGSRYLARAAAADIWIVSPAQHPKHICKVIRVNSERLRRDGPHGGSGSQSSNNLWEDFVKEYDARVAAWSSLSHANIVRVLGASSELNLEVEYYENGCVWDYLKAHSSTVNKVAMILDVLAGMEYLHQHSPPIVHGNVNAGKLFVDCYRKTAVGEFGLVGLCYPFAAYAPLISFTGLTHWFGLELLDDDADHIPQPTLASDVWALGCTLYEIVAEILPYSDYKHEIRVQQVIIAGEPPGRREVTHHGFLWPIIESCWTPTPENRPNPSKLARDVRVRSPKRYLATSVAISPGGQPTIASSDNKAVGGGDAQTGAALFESLRGHLDWVASVAISSDGQCIVSGSWDKTVRIWDAQTGATLFEPLQGHSDAVTCVAIPFDGRLIVSGSRDRTVRIWDAHTGVALLKPLIGHNGVVTSVAISSDGRRIVSGSWDETVRIWDTQTGAALLEPLQGHSDVVTCVAIPFDGQRIVSGSNHCGPEAYG